MDNWAQKQILTAPINRHVRAATEQPSPRPRAQASLLGHLGWWFFVFSMALGGASTQQVPVDGAPGHQNRRAFDLGA